jgi:hypothetical protein
MGDKKSEPQLKVKIKAKGEAAAKLLSSNAVSKAIGHDK